MRPIQPSTSFFGRQGELARLDDLWQDVVANGSATALICGEAGIGKSTLVERFLSSTIASATNMTTATVVRARCPAHGFDPLGPIDALLSATAHITFDERLDEGRPSDRGSMPTIEEAQLRRSRAIVGAARTLVRSGRSQPQIVVLDDLHWASEPVLDFVQVLLDELAQSATENRILFLAVTRVLPPPHRLAHILEAADRHTRVSRLDIEELDVGSIEQIVGDEVTDDPSRTFLDLVGRSARGSPLRARAAIKVLRQRGVPTGVPASDSRTWAAMRFPLGLDDPVRMWIDDLTSLDAVALGAVAVLGTDFTLRMLADVADLDLAVASSCAADAVAAGLLASDGVNMWFAHSTFRDVLYDRLGPIELQAAHRRCVRHLISSPDRASAAIAIAIGHHCLGADDLPLDVERFDALVQAGRAAYRLTMWNDAARYLEAAGQLAADGTTSVAAIDLHVLLGNVYYFDHDTSAAESHLRLAIESAATSGDEAVWASALVTLIRMTISVDPASWRRPYDDGPARHFLDVATDPGRRAQVHEVLAEAQVVAGRFDEAETNSDAAVALARASGSASILAMAIYSQAFTDMAMMRVRQSLDRTLEAKSHATRGDDWYIEGIMKGRLPFPLLAVGRLADADRAAADSTASAAENHEHSNQALGHCVRAATALLRGDFAMVEQFGAAGRLSTRRSGYVMADLFLAPTLVINHIYRDELDAAATIARDWPNLPDSARTALLGVIHGRQNKEIAHANETVRRPTSVNQITIGFYAARLEAALLRGDTAVLGSAPDDLARWSEDGLEFAPSYPVSLTRLRGEIMLAVGDVEQAAHLLTEAAAICETAGAYAELARVYAAQARTALGRSDGSGSSVELMTRAIGVADRIGMARAVLNLDDILASAEVDGALQSGDRRVVMITDVVGSTVVSHRLGDVAYLDLVLRHHEIVRRVLHQWAGQEFSESGDGLLAWFDDPSHALLAAAQIQETIRSTAQIEPRLEVKVALASGHPLFHNGRPYGLVVNRAARVLDGAGSGEIVVDEEFASTLPQDFAVTATRHVELRGIGSHRISAVQLGSDHLTETVTK